MVPQGSYPFLKTARHNDMKLPIVSYHYGRGEKRSTVLHAELQQEDANLLSGF